MHNKSKNILAAGIVSVGIILLLSVLGAFNGTTTYTQSLGGVATSTGVAYQVVGTRLGTTTTTVHFGTAAALGRSATTTYPIRVNETVDTVSFFFDVVNASTTPAGQISNSDITVSFLSSNDRNCESELTDSSPDNKPLKSHIRWFDAGRSALGLTNTLEIPRGTTTVRIYTKAGEGNEVTLTNVNARCLALEVSGSSTEMQVTALTKSLKNY